MDCFLTVMKSRKSLIEYLFFSNVYKNTKNITKVVEMQKSFYLLDKI